MFLVHLGDIKLTLIAFPNFRAGQIPAAGSTYAYAYASMGELPAVVAAGCLSLEYLVSASAIARGKKFPPVFQIHSFSYVSLTDII